MVTILLAVTVAERTGLLGAAIRVSLGSAPRWLLPYAVGLRRRHRLGDGRRRRSSSCRRWRRWSSRPPAATRSPGWSAGSPPSARATPPRWSSPASTPSSPASPTRSPTGLPDPGADGHPGLELLLQHRLVARARARGRPGHRPASSSRGWCARARRATWWRATTPADGARRGSRRRGRRPRAARQPRPTSPPSSTRPSGAACGWPGWPSLVLVRGHPGRGAAGRLAVAQRGRRLPAGVAAARLDGLHRLRAVPRPGAGLRLRQRLAAARGRRAEGDGARHQGHGGLHRAGLHARPVHRALQLDQRRLGARRHRRRRAGVDRPDRATPRSSASSCWPRCSTSSS